MLRENSMFDATTPPTRVELRRGALFAWNRPQAARLRVLHGMAWVTCSNDLSDHFLVPGAELLLPRGAQVLIGAERDLALSLERVHGDNAEWPRTNRSSPAANAAAPLPNGWASARAAAPGTR
jgi:hypothetical protein